MSDKYFLDTNILVYSFDRSVPQKRQRAKKLIGEALEKNSGVISFQVVQEFINFSLKQSSSPAQLQKLHTYFIKVLKPLCVIHSSISLYRAALSIKEKTKYSWYDSLVIAGAKEAGCTVIFSEDLQHNHAIEQMVITNPFIEI